MKYLILTVFLITVSAYAFVNQFMQMPQQMMSMPQQMMCPPCECKKTN